MYDFVFSFQIQQFVESGQLNWAVEQLTVLSELAKLLSDSRCCNLTKFVKEMHLHWQKILLNKLARYNVNQHLNITFSFSCYVSNE